MRRIEVELLLLRDGWDDGAQARIARNLGVSPSTISRDVRAIFRVSVECICGTRYSREWWRDESRIGPGRYLFDPTRHFDEDEAGRWKLVLVRNREPKADRAARTSDQREVDRARIDRFMKLTDEMTAEFAAGTVEKEPAGADGVDIEKVAPVDATRHVEIID